MQLLFLILKNMLSKSAIKKSAISHLLWQPVGNSPLIVFRVLFGLVMFGQCVRWVVSGWVREMYVLPGYNFTFIGFEWLNVLHGSGMYVYFGCTALLSLLVCAGLFYRVSAFLLAILISAIYLSCKTHYNNHYYLMVLLCWFMAAMPANNRFSLDAKLNITSKSVQCYQWQLWLFIFQVACVYVFAAIAKMNADWLHAIPMKEWIHIKSRRPYIGWFLKKSWMPWLIVYGGLLFDLLVVPGLLYRKTRIWFFLLAAGFHVFNGVVFQIGSFPFMAMSLFVFFFPSGLFDRFLPSANDRHLLQGISTNKKGWTNYAVGAFVALQLFLPIRHLFFTGSVGWTEEGHRMSWQMMLRSKRGAAYFTVKNKATDSMWTMKPDSFVNKESLREVAVLPDVTWQAAQLLKQKCAEKGMDVSVFAHCNASLNYRPYQPLIDSTVDLANVKWNYFGHNRWILLNE